jgi:hypothetical protein
VDDLAFVRCTRTNDQQFRVWPIPVDWLVSPCVRS